MYITKKKIGKYEYYYLRKSERKNGRVRAVNVAYLGKDKVEADKKAKEIIAKMSGDKLITNKKPNFEEGKMNQPEKIDDNSTQKENSKEKNLDKEKEFTSFIQEAGLIWGPEPEIYGGLAGFYTYGPLGKLLKNKVENSVRRIFNSHGLRELEGPTVMPDVVWKASGHLGTFADRIIKCKKCKSVFRADKLIEEKFDVSADSFSDDKVLAFIEEKGIRCPSCSGSFEHKIEKQSLMMKTKVAGQDASLRPETATVTYLPFLRVLNYFRKKIPFGVYQIGKAYRNEISPRQSVLRGREFTQAEGQLFVDPLMKNSWDKFVDVKGEMLPLWNWEKQKQDNNQNKKEELMQNSKDGFWDGSSGMSLDNAIKKGMIKSQAYAWCLWLAYTQFRNFGIPSERIRIRQHWPDEKAFYADDAWDIEVKTNNYGWVEVCGVHDRTDYDLKQHSKESGVALEAIRENGERFVPHILEIAFGTDRPTYVLMDLFYDKKMEGEGKTTFKVPYQMAPIDVSIFPLMKKPELTKVAREIKEDLEREFVIDYDESGSIGKRYLRAAISGTPFAITVDFDSLTGNDVTIRDRDSEKQIRVKISELKEKLKKLLSGEEKI